MLQHTKLGLYQLNDLNAEKPRLGKPAQEGNVTPSHTDLNEQAVKPEMVGELKANLYEIQEWLKGNHCPVHKERLVRDCPACVGRWNKMCADLNK